MDKVLEKQDSPLITIAEDESTDLRFLCKILRKGPDRVFGGGRWNNNAGSCRS